MIRKLQNADIDPVADIWLEANRKAHDFIPAQYWLDSYAPVKETLPKTEVYVYANDEKIQGFVGLNGEYIEGLFVSNAVQSQGIGKALLDFIKAGKAELHLNVYQKNVRAIRFYQREGFEIQTAGFDEATSEHDYAMTWRKN